MTAKQPRWYQEAIIYELHIRAFSDSNQDGSGDFRGLVDKLDYLQDLGITAIWLLPFYPSPLRDDGYDIADYTRVHNAYGNLADFKLFLREAHQRNIRVITELVLNHTSDQHPWFQRARQAKPDSPWRDFYIWNDNDKKYPQARIIFQDFETSNWTWDPLAQAYYWHRFYSHQPDLNYDNPAVQKAVQEWVDFWLEMGVDGLRLDAVPYLFKREGTHCENLPETHQFLKKLRKYIDNKFPDRMLLAEANQWPEDAIAYFGNADECNMAFHFPLMPRMYMSLQMEDRFPLIDIMQQTPGIPETCQWSIFLRNHDELTLEMVTDAEREYMYQAYAKNPQARINLGIRRRLAPLLNNNRKKIELMNGLLFSFPGTPVIYYGDEIGMGDNFYLNDRNSVRTPMQWTADSNAGFSNAHPHQLFLPVNIDPEYHYESVNVAAQQKNPESLWWWMKKIIALRKRYRALSLGKLNFLHPENSAILAYITQYQAEKILVLVNLSRFSQYTELDLSQWQGLRLVELFGQTLFPEINEKPYAFTLGAHNFYWFLLTESNSAESQPPSPEKQPAVLEIKGEWDSIMQNAEKHKLETILPAYLISQRWFNQKSQSVEKVDITEIIPVNSSAHLAYILFVTVTDSQADTHAYILPVTLVSNTEAKSLMKKFPSALLARLPLQQGYLIDAFYARHFNSTLFQAMAADKKLKSRYGCLIGRHIGKLAAVTADSIQPLQREQSNTSILFSKQFILKNYRHCQHGVNPELEILQFLTDKAHFAHSAELAGYLEYKDKNDGVISVSLLQKYCEHKTDAWQLTLKKLAAFFEKIPSTQLKKIPSNLVKYLPTQFFPCLDIPTQIQTLVGDYGSAAHLLGQRTAELHIALASGNDSAFVPESLSMSYQRNLYQSIRGQLGRTLMQLRRALPNLPASVQADCAAVLQTTPIIEAAIQPLIQHHFEVMRTRIHGDLHLGQVLYTGKDFIFVDFEGEPQRTLAERRAKRSPLCDIAGMLRSFDYAAQTALTDPALQAWATLWQRWVANYFIAGYVGKSKTKDFLPTHEKDRNTLLKIFLIEKTIYEIQYELNNRPNLLSIPCRGLLSFKD